MKTRLFQIERASVYNCDNEEVLSLKIKTWIQMDGLVALILECIQLNKYYMLFCSCCYIIVDIIIMLIINPPQLHLHCHQQYQYQLSLLLT